MFAPKQFFLPLIKKTQVANDVYSLYFDRAGYKEFNFFPGQYIRMTLPINATDGRGSSRFFTIASSPHEKNYLMITTKKGRSDFKNALLQLQNGESIIFFGPIGGFYLREQGTTMLTGLYQETHEYAFLAAGIGITPFHSMITYAAEKKLTMPITLFASFSTLQDLIFYEELTTVAKELQNVKVVYTITKSQESQVSWTGEKGRISEVLLKKYIQDITKPTYFIAGSPAMVEGTEELLRSLQIPDNQIRIDSFTGY